MILRRPEHELKQRTNAIRSDLKRRYDLDALKEQLYREQESICAICKKPMQDSSSVICTVDHAISVFDYATWDYTIAEACEYANAKHNLLVVHISCNSAKREADYEEFVEGLERGEIVLGKQSPLTPEKIQELKTALFERSRKAGLIAGRKSVESGHLDKIRELPKTKEAQRKAGRIRGRLNVESGHIIRINELPQTKEAKRETIRRMPRELKMLGGRTSGRQNVESGHMSKIQSLGGRIRGRQMVESGQLASIRELPQSKEAQRENGRKAAESGHCARMSGLGHHIRWHLKRGTVNPKCSLCVAA